MAQFYSYRLRFIALRLVRSAGGIQHSLALLRVVSAHADERCFHGFEAYDLHIQACHQEGMAPGAPINSPLSKE
jgi:hypothetical protein